MIRLTLNVISRVATCETAASEAMGVNVSQPITPDSCNAVLARQATYQTDARTQMPRSVFEAVFVPLQESCCSSLQTAGRDLHASDHSGVPLVS